MSEMSAYLERVELLEEISTPLDCGVCYVNPSIEGGLCADCALNRAEPES